MRKVFLAVLLLVAATTIYGQSPTEEASVGVWVVADKPHYRTRVINELASIINNHSDWNLDFQLENWDADVHVVVSGMPVGESLYAWSITVTPIFAPRWTNGSAAIAAANISGMNWVAQTTADYLITQLYAWYDSTLSSTNATL